MASCVAVSGRHRRAKVEAGVVRLSCYSPMEFPCCYGVIKSLIATPEHQCTILLDITGYQTNLHMISLRYCMNDYLCLEFYIRRM